ncbi:hypothetical protein [Streptomyces sp. NPDC093109]|uniref:hypothetical protein n=1 Tax=Streptomyces sp. NPDC093109 TaxID=3154977 RepID=UPI003450310B
MDEVWRVTARTATDGYGDGYGDGAVRVGEILIDDADFPWLRGLFTPGPGFAPLKPLFNREVALLGRINEEPDAWAAACEEIERSVVLAAPAGPVAEFLLHISGDRAWFRWSDNLVTED